jgi:hypothetical protein
VVEFATDKNLELNAMIDNQKQQKVIKRNHSYVAESFDWFWLTRAHLGQRVIGGEI